MPNWCSNEFSIVGSETDAREFMRKHLTPTTDEDTGLPRTDDRHEMDFNQFIPEPSDLGEGGWYNWRIENWGTKWQPAFLVANRLKGIITIQCETAWSPPRPIAEAISKMYPLMVVRLQYFEEGMDYWGVCVFQGGEMVAAVSAEGEWEKDEDWMEVSDAEN